MGNHFSYSKVTIFFFYSKVLQSRGTYKLHIVTWEALKIQVFEQNQWKKKKNKLKKLKEKKKVNNNYNNNNDSDKKEVEVITF